MFVVYDFPPATSSGVFRPLRFLKRLSEHGWAATVVAPRIGRGRLLDPALERRVPSDVRVVRTAAPEPRLAQLALGRIGLRGTASWIDRWARVPDAQRGWVPFAVRAARRELARERHELIWTTSAPYSAHLIGLALRDARHLPWVADFRDEWGTHPDLCALLPSRWHRRLHRRLERAVLDGADRIVGVSDPFVDDLRRAAPDKPGDRFLVLPNGFDEDDFEGAPPAAPERYTAVYAGVVYERGPLETLLEGVRRACRSGRVDPARLAVELIGHGNESIRAELPSGVLRTRGQLPHDDAIREIRRAQLLLLFADPHRGPGVFPGKLFPYLAAGRPILALADRRSGVARVVGDAGAGAVVAPGDADGVARALAEGFARWVRGEPDPVPRPEVVRSFGSRAQTARLVALFDALVAASA